MNLMKDQQAPQSAEGEAKVITLCGSTTFEAEFAEVNQRLTMEGCVVISLGMFSLPDRETAPRVSPTGRSAHRHERPRGSRQMHACEGCPQRRSVVARCASSRDAQPAARGF